MTTGSCTAAWIAILILVGYARSQTLWTDQTPVSSTVFYGPNLARRGDSYNLDGTIISKTAVSYAAKSVMTGLDSFYPPTLPSSLKVPFLTPDSWHPNLAFWYTPDVFARDGMADGELVSEWVNVANICYSNHWDSTYCTALKNRNAQVGTRTRICFRRRFAGSQ